MERILFLQTVNNPLHGKVLGIQQALTEPTAQLYPEEFYYSHALLPNI